MTDSSETIAHRQRRKAWWISLLKIIVPSAIVLAVILIIFFDPKVLVISFGVIMAFALFLIISVGGTAKKKSSYSSENRSTFKGRYNNTMPNTNYGRHAKGQTSSKATSGVPDAYTSVEGYHDLVENLHSPAGGPVRGPAQSGGSEKKQSQLGAQVSNTALIVLLLIAAVTIWIFG